MRFQPVNCNMMQLTRKRTKTIIAIYSLEGTVLENVDSIKYLGVTISKDLKWNTHISYVCTKANRTLGFLRQKLSSYIYFTAPPAPLPPSPTKDVKKMAYKGLVQPILDYASPVWDPHGVVKKAGSSGLRRSLIISLAILVDKWLVIVEDLVIILTKRTFQLTVCA